MITVETLQALGTTPENAAKYLDHLNDAAELFQIEKPEHVAAWLAQLAVESAGFSAVEENLNYSAAGLVRAWPNRFYVSPTGIPDAALASGRAWAPTYARAPERLANLVYSERMGNGDWKSGDGWKYRGRGLKQLTGRDNYRLCSRWLYGDEQVLIKEPDRLLEPEPACKSAAWYWSYYKLCNALDTGGIDAVSKKINGGVNGLAERRRLYAAAIQTIGVA